MGERNQLPSGAEGQFVEDASQVCFHCGIGNEQGFGYIPVAESFGGQESTSRTERSGPMLGPRLAACSKSECTDPGAITE